MRALLAVLALTAGSISCTPIPKFKVGDQVLFEQVPGVVATRYCDWARCSYGVVFAGRSRVIDEQFLSPRYSQDMPVDFADPRRREGVWI